MPKQSASSAARAMFKRAIADSATQLGIQGSDAAIEFFRHGSCDQCSVLRHNLARRIGDYLSTVDPNLEGVYLFDPDAGCDVYEDFHTVSTPWCALNLIVWTRTSKAVSQKALGELREALDKPRAQVLCPKATALCFALNPTVVNNAEVRARQGYAAMIDSFRARPTQVWNGPQPARPRASKNKERP